MTKAHSYAAPILAFALSFLSMSACAEPPPPVQNAGTIRVSVGMPVSELRTVSTYPIGGQGDDLGFFTVTRRHDLTYIDDGRELAFRDLGSSNFFTAVLSSQGLVDGVTVQPQRDRVTLDEALKEAERIHQWFVSAGYRPERGGMGFQVFHANGEAYPKRVLTFEDARAALLDPDAKIAEASLISLSKPGGHVGMGIMIYNSRRMRAAQNPRFNDESNAADERTYSLSVTIAAEGEGPR